MRILKNFLASNGHFFILMAISIASVYISGARIDFANMPDPRERVLALFTEVPDGFVSVVEVIDGDTIVVNIGGKEETVRMLGVDTPETKDPRRPVQCFGKEASLFSKSLLLGEPVKLVSDPQETDKDKYGRLLRYVYLQDGTMVNERLVYEGFAFVYEEFPTGRTDVLKKMQADAQKNKRGLWGGCEVNEKKSGNGYSTAPIKN